MTFVFFTLMVNPKAVQNPINGIYYLHIIFPVSNIVRLPEFLNNQLENLTVE